MGVVVIEENPYDVGSICKLLADRCPSVRVAGLANGVEKACRVMLGSDFDAVLLDIDILGDGVPGALERMSGYCADKGIIVVSSTTEHAFESFKYSAVDYVLKPLGFRDVVKALDKSERLKRETEKKGGVYSIGAPVTIVAIPSLSDVKILRVDEIAYLQSDGRYTVFYTVNDETIVSSKHLGHYEKMLSMNKNFYRIHHSYLVNVDLAMKVYKKDGVYLEILNKKYLPISKRKADAFYKYLGV